ncbi:hypothetical protein HISP_16441 [Haloarcula hispanica N601]|uniref:Uncharacterized protein n=1 Tax=Haloarcula hispanica N601 TaxID=1417673 RepID=W0GHV1_HALHI|nr:hypothetical protein HISP_16441 [Haloarcula hispanica N601]
MKRRKIITSTLSVIFLSGCTTDSNDQYTLNSTSTEPTPNSTSTGSTPSAGDCYPQFCRGTKLVDVVVDADFSGTVVVEAACRERSYKLQSGDSITITRKVDGESCDIIISANNQTVYNQTIADYVSISLRVGPDGNVSRSAITEL